MKKTLILLLLPIITFAQKEVVIHIQTDSYPSETKWTLYKDAYQGSVIASANEELHTEIISLINKKK